MQETVLKQPPIAVPACVRRAEHNALHPNAWADKLGETFTDLDVATFEAVGRFRHMEAPERAAAEIARFFSAGQAETPA